MTKSKKHAPQELTDDELMQVTGGYRWVSESNYNSISQACKNLKDKEGCVNNTNCYWSKDHCRVSHFIQADPKLKGNEEYKG